MEVRWRDQDELYGTTTYFCGVIYDDGVRVDYTVWPDALLERVSGEASLPEGLDVGYRVCSTRMLGRRAGNTRRTKHTSPQSRRKRNTTRS